MRADIARWRTGNVYVALKPWIGKFSAASDHSPTQMKHRAHAMVQSDMTRFQAGGIDVNKALLAALSLGLAAAAGCSTQGQVDPDVMQIATKP